MATDPICGMQVDESTDLTVERHGQTFYFCSDHCRRKFLAQEEAEDKHSCCHEHAPSEYEARDKASKYICPMCEGVESDKPGNCPKCGMALEPAKPKAHKQKKIYTCPMHPEIEQDHPGDCPKCGMALERIGEVAPGPTIWSRHWRASR